MKVTKSQLKQIIKEELKIVLDEKHTWPEEESSVELEEEEQYVKSFYTAKEKKADELIASGTDEDDAYGIADTIVSKQGKKKKKKRGKKWWDMLEVN